jgi:hypothetical protein
MGNYSQAQTDVECYRNYFLIKAPGFNFEVRPHWMLPNVMRLRFFLASHEIITFNGNNYDVPMIAACLHLITSNPAITPTQLCASLKAYSDSIIVGRVKGWQFYKQNNIPKLHWLKHIDLFEVAPGVGIGLKMYMGRMHSETLQDLPVEPSANLTEQEMNILENYCGNDLTGTKQLQDTIKGRLELRRQISIDLDVDVMSKSDAQISESTIVAKLGFYPDKVTYPHGYQFNYQPPPFIKFKTAQMQQVLATVLTNAFTVNDVDQIKDSHARAMGLSLDAYKQLMEDTAVLDADGRKMKTGIIIPPAVAALRVSMGSSVYKFGIGGLHSQEKSIFHLTEPGKWSLSDHDVASYYPSLILLMNMYPKAIGEAFIEIYRRVYVERLHAKNMANQLEKSGDKEGAERWKTIADSLKIVLNGAFGKLGSKYSILFAPELLIRTTITGQLALLMLIEDMELAGIPVVSANTDGIIVKTPAGLESTRDAILRAWEAATGLETEETKYTAVFSRDVNNYIAFKPDGKWKAKGCFGESGVNPKASPTGKNPDIDICSDAVIAYLARGTPLYTTIRSCTDIRKFITVATCAGGGYWEGTGEVLGKTVRWYYGKGSTHAIRSTKLKKGQTIGNMVAGSTGSVPCMRLPAQLPADIDYEFYEREAYKMLGTIGVR